MFEPFENVEMRSMIEDAYPEESFAHPKFSVPTVIPGRTFLEKVFLLHEEFNRPGGCTRLDRLTRHMYRKDDGPGFRQSSDERFRNV